jgi:hypothetical protein
MRAQLLLAAALLLALPGCETTYLGAGAERGGIPARPPGATYPNWEYLCAAPRTIGGFTEALNEAGRSGWEMVAVTPQGITCFKRPTAPAAPQVAPPTWSPPAAPRP